MKHFLDFLVAVAVLGVISLVVFAVLDTLEGARTAPTLRCGHDLPKGDGVAICERFESRTCHDLDGLVVCSPWREDQ